MSFSFGFSGDDVGDDIDVAGQSDGVPARAEAQSQFVGLPAEEHSLDDLVGSYTVYSFNSPAAHDLFHMSKFTMVRLGIYCRSRIQATQTDRHSHTRPNQNTSDNDCIAS